MPISSVVVLPISINSNNEIQYYLTELFAFFKNETRVPAFAPLGGRVDSKHRAKAKQLKSGTSVSSEKDSNDEKAKQLKASLENISVENLAAAISALDEIIEESHGVYLNNLVHLPDEFSSLSRDEQCVSFAKLLFDSQKTMCFSSKAASSTGETLYFVPFIKNAEDLNLYQKQFLTSLEKITKEGRAPSEEWFEVKGLTTVTTKELATVGAKLNSNLQAVGFPVFPNKYPEKEKMDMFDKKTIYQEQTFIFNGKEKKCTVDEYGRPVEYDRKLRKSFVLDPTTGVATSEEGYAEIAYVSAKPRAYGVTRPKNYPLRDISVPSLLAIYEHLNAQRQIVDISQEGGFKNNKQDGPISIDTESNQYLTAKESEYQAFLICKLNEAFGIELDGAHETFLQGYKTGEGITLRRTFVESNPDSYEQPNKIIINKLNEKGIKYTYDKGLPQEFKITNKDSIQKFDGLVNETSSYQVVDEFTLGEKTEGSNFAKKLAEADFKEFNAKKGLKHCNIYIYPETLIFHIEFAATGFIAGGALSKELKTGTFLKDAMVSGQARVVNLYKKAADLNELNQLCKQFGLETASKEESKDNSQNSAPQNSFFINSGTFGEPPKPASETTNPEPSKNDLERDNPSSRRPSSQTMKPSQGSSSSFFKSEEQAKPGPQNGPENSGSKRASSQSMEQLDDSKGKFFKQDEQQNNDEKKTEKDPLLSKGQNEDSTEGKSNRCCIIV